MPTDSELFAPLGSMHLLPSTSYRVAHRIHFCPTQGYGQLDACSRSGLLVKNHCLSCLLAFPSNGLT